LSIGFLAHIADNSDGIIYIMALLLTVALTVSIERSWFLRSALRRGDTLTRAVAKLHNLHTPELEDLATASRGTPHVAVIQAVLAHAGLRDPVRLAEVLEEAILWQAPEVDRRLWVLDTIITLAPLLGLLGTIIGMFNTFQVLGSNASAPTAITGGVAEALVATACGLCIAIMGLVFFNGLNASVRRVVHQMEMLKVMLVNRLAIAQLQQELSEPTPRSHPQPLRLRN
jgi:biopolymer transport protein ExbB